MLPQDQSPIHILVSKWWTSRPPVSDEIAACRAALFTAATHEITGNANAGTAYNPLHDRRFQWAAQWIDRTIDPDIHHLAATFFNPPRQRDHKELACGPA
jgi:hypothetical protein